MDVGSNISTRKKIWSLTPESFETLLAFLDADRDRAAEKYEDLRRMLISFFEFRGLRDVEDKADEVINRVARRLSEKQEITVSPSTYFYAVARNVWRELLAQNQAIKALEREYAVNNGRAAEQHEQQALQERRLECLEHSLQALPLESRELLAQYYEGQGQHKIRIRKDLAARLGIPLNALRIRALRLREKLREQVQNCLDQSPGK
jgi:RNA polymerase sigma factor (sigma-70 family)